MCFLHGFTESLVVSGLEKLKIRPPKCLDHVSGNLFLAKYFGHLTAGTAVDSEIVQSHQLQTK